MSHPRSYFASSLVAVAGIRVYVTSYRAGHKKPRLRLKERDGDHEPDYNGLYVIPKGSPQF